MPKSSSSLDLVLPSRPAGVPAYRWLYSALRDEILHGGLRPGARLPATRDLARQYCLARGTVINAFDQLKSEGYVAGTIGSGTYVSEILPDTLLSTGRQGSRHVPVRSKRKRLVSRFANRIRPLPSLETRPTRAFRTNLPALNLFPIATWERITARMLRRASTNLLLGCPPMGYRPLQEALADYLTSSRGVKCVPDQIVIVSGAQEALDLAGRLLLNPGDHVAMEDPGYIGAASVFEALGVQILPICTDDEGMCLATGRLRGARLIYVTPAHQFPLGITMSLARRLQLLEWAHKTDAMIFEDDYDSEFRYAGRPIPALQGLDSSGQVLFAGSFSKVLFPSLRLGYLVVPPDLVDLVATIRSVTTRHPPLLEQAVLSEFITEGHFGRHLRRMRQAYAHRLSVLLDYGRRELSGLLEISNIEAGLQTVGWLLNGMSDREARKAAAARGVEVTPLSAYSRCSLQSPGLQLGFAAVDEHEIKRGIRELVVALDTRSNDKSRKRSLAGSRF